MPSASRTVAVAVVVGVVVVVLGAAASSAHADGFDGQRFVPAAGAAGGFEVERPIVPRHLGFGAGLFLHYSLDPVVERDLATGRQLDQPLHHAFTFDVLASIAFFDHLELAVHLPIDAVYTGDATVIGGQGIRAGPGVGDLRIVPKAMFWRDGTMSFHWALGMMIPIAVPSGDAASLRGSGGVTIDPRLLGGFGGRRWELTLNLGYRWRSNGGPANLYGPGEVTYGLAATFTLPVWKDRIDLDAELVGGYNHAGVGRNVAKSPLELVLGVILHPHHDWSVYGGASIGLTSGIGTPDFRVIAGVRYARRLVGREGYRDSDGDGIIDANDKCPHQAEDQDGFEDSDGCPDDDNDRDGIPDDDDECPDVAGERRSGDGNGCPDKGYVVVRHGKLLIFGKVLFETGSTRLTRPSEDLVDQIGAALHAHPEIHHVQVQGHTDNVGPRDMNLRLSHERADAVKRSLIARGVNHRRLSSQGYGETHPIASNNTRGGRAKNRRVEFVVTRD
jgi:OmpA-OmpF porin, OOP family